LLSSSKRAVALLISIAALSSCTRSAPPSIPPNPQSATVRDYRSASAGVRVTPYSLCWKNSRGWRCSGRSSGGAGPCEITSQTVNPPAPQSRTTIGVGEQVTITTTDGYGFTVSGDGTLSLGTTNQTTLTGADGGHRYGIRQPSWAYLHSKLHHLRRCAALW